MVSKLPKFFTEDEMVSIASHPERDTLIGARDRAILGVFCAAGLRVSELCHLQVRDVRPALLFVRQAKFGLQRWVPISKRCQLAIQGYLAIHPAQPGDPLFRSVTGNALDRRMVHKIVTYHQRAVGLSGGVHMMRASAATRWLNRGVNLQTVRVMLGHANISTTAIYLGVATDSMVREYQNCLEWAAAGGGDR